MTDSSPCEGHTKFQVNDTCVLVEELKNTNWFEARWQCIKNGGDLLDIPDEAFEDAVRDSLECWQSPLWIGVTRTAWFWLSGWKPLSVKVFLLIQCPCAIPNCVCFGI